MEKRLAICAAAFVLIGLYATVQTSFAENGMVRLALKPAARSTKQEAASAKRKVHFPTRNAVGTLRAGPGRNPAEGSWHELGPAIGVVCVPAGLNLELVVSPDVSDLSFLRTMHANEFVSLVLNKVQVPQSQFSYLEKLTGLVHLKLNDTNISDRRVILKSCGLTD